jgi:hypothetical protein
MISSSQISLFQDSSRQVSAFDSTQLRINRQSAAAPQANENAVGSELTLMRQAAYRYSSQEQLAFSGSSTVTDGGQQSVFTSAQLAEKTSELFLMGQQALSVSRAALGGDAGVEGRGSVSVSAGRYMFYSESESRSFASTGTIALENGETIDFTLSLRQSQSRTYEYSELVQIQERPLTDPLVINFGSATARLTDTLFEFDLNGNGEPPWAAVAATWCWTEMATAKWTTAPNCLVPGAAPALASWPVSMTTVTAGLTPVMRSLNRCPCGCKPRTAPRL